ncbi:molybdate ABC transporter substrate-binding protein [Rhodovibrio sodomensis]|uniref:Molybdate ABC transporter substrate-binding protein n=1 Tax=Rhodovibrio sodomensis TaxID=1088 RepID=A0ABS1DC76_9PROT|nr:molybdate ABC transporter substrate-binding protein [Rhodovibrio sodomensis]MBK1667188.1 molybdate ABC transporter substrate-binding protein [Rhodovibrio sodomensis]
MTHGWLRGVLLAMLLLLAGPVQASGQVTVFAAASTTDAVQAVLSAFRETHPGIPVRASFAASSTLAKQIARGAPAHLYLSANAGWMDYLERRGAIDPDSRIDLLSNRLVLVAPTAAKVSAKLPALPEALGDRRLAIGDPAHVPAGIYAKQALQSLGLWGRLRDRLAYAANVRAALALVARREAAAGIVYATDARISDDVQTVTTLPANSHDPIDYPLARVAGADGPGARALYAFFRSDRAQAIFRDHGFALAQPAGAS